MPMIEARDGTGLYFKSWGEGRNRCSQATAIQGMSSPTLLAG